jgi:rubrerythrin
MLELTNDEKMCSVEDSLRMLENQIPDSLSEKMKDEIFMEDYNDMLNRFRWLAQRICPIKPKLHKMKDKRYNDYYTCGACGKIINGINDDYCSGCGRKIGWDSPRCLTEN